MDVWFFVGIGMVFWLFGVASVLRDMYGLDKKRKKR